MFTRLRKLGIVSIMTTIVVIGGLGLKATPARADAGSCTGAPNGYVCANVYGSGTWVDHGWIMDNRLNPAASWICNYQARFTAWYPAGGSRTWYSPYHSGCSYAGAWFNVGIYSNLPNQTLLCGYWMEDGSTKASLCYRVHS